MKIGGKKGVGSGGYVKNATGNKQSGKGGQASASDAKQGGDSVAFSSKAKQLNRTKALLENVPEIRGEMVVKLKTDIERGDYNVDAGKVAEKMIERALINTLHTKK